MGSALADPFRHHTWATRKLVTFCRALTPESLRASTAGTYGNVLETLRHLVGADEWYRQLLTGSRPERAAGEPDVGELAKRAEEAERFWMSFFAGDVDTEATIVFDGDNGREEMRVGVLLAQVLNHGNVHREQVSANLTSVGIEAPPTSGWAWGDETGAITASKSE